MVSGHFIPQTRSTPGGAPTDHAGGSQWFHRTAGFFTILVAGFASGCGDDSGTNPDPIDPVWASVDAGRAHACALTDEGVAYCWGNNDAGQLGIAGAGPVTAPTAVATAERFVEIEAGGDHSCGLTAGGELFCWGDNQFGQLGDGGAFDSSVPARVIGGHTWSHVSVGTYHVCGVDEARALRCWGADRWDVALGYRATGICTDTPFEPTWPCSGNPRVVDMGGSWDWVAVGLYHTCAGTDGAPGVCWGTNDLGQLGTTTTGTCAGNDPLHPSERACSRSPVAPDGPDLDRLVPGATHGCGLRAALVFCWGALTFDWGQIGNGDLGGEPAPVAVSGIGSVRSVVVSAENHVRSFSCAIADSGEASCWGANRWGQLGSETTELCEPGGVPCSSSPAAITHTAGFQELSLGTEFACGVDDEGQILCWGFNTDGQLGDGTLTSRATPAPIPAPV